jgi:hypothetical protein
MHQAYWTKILYMDNLFLLWDQGYKSSIELSKITKLSTLNDRNCNHDIRFDYGPADFIEASSETIWAGALSEGRSIIVSHTSRSEQGASRSARL